MVRILCTLGAGAGDITVDGDIGSLTQLSTLTITSANNVSLQDVTATTFTQSAGTGTTTINGDMNTNAPGGIAITTSGVTLDGDMTTINGGPITITNSGTFTTAAAENITRQAPSRKMELEGST